MARAREERHATTSGTELGWRAWAPRQAPAGCRGGRLEDRSSAVLIPDDEPTDPWGYFATCQVDPAIEITFDEIHDGLQGLHDGGMVALY